MLREGVRRRQRIVKALALADVRLQPVDQRAECLIGRLLGQHVERVAEAHAGTQQPGQFAGKNHDVPGTGRLPAQPHGTAGAGATSAALTSIGCICCSDSRRNTADLSLPSITPVTLAPSCITAR